MMTRPSLVEQRRQVRASIIHGPLGRELITTIVVPDRDDLAFLIADRMVDVIAAKTARGGKCILGLATGNTPIGVYRELIRRHRKGDVGFARVITFNLDEYYPMDPESVHSYARFMWENLFSHVDIPPKSVHIPDGSVPRCEVSTHCEAYERCIVQHGGIDFQILGIGRNGHIGFNEPGSPPHSRTRLVTVDPVTRRDTAGDSSGRENFPWEALTMGIATILEAREIVLMATGEHKAPIVRRAVEGVVTADVPATFLQRHTNASVYLDGPAASELTRIKPTDR